jgi:hypothetical protein
MLDDIYVHRGTGEDRRRERGNELRQVQHQGLGRSGVG